MNNSLDIKVEVSNFFPGGEGGVQGAYVILNAPTALFDQYKNRANPGLTLWRENALADKLPSCAVDHQIHSLREVVSHLQGEVCVELCSQDNPNRARFLVYEKLYH